MANEYVTAANLKVPLSISGTADDVWLGIVATAASRAIDSFCQRRFYADANATARWFRALSGHLVDVDDVSTTTGLVVATDDNDDGTAETTWLAADYELQPLNGVSHGQAWPYTAILAVESRTFPRSLRAAVSVTAKWGWPAVPAEVTQAAYILGAELFKRKDAPFGVAGFGDFGVVRIRDDPRLLTLLSPFVLARTVAG